MIFKETKINFKVLTADWLSFLFSKWKSGKLNEIIEFLNQVYYISQDILEMSNILLDAYLTSSEKIVF